MSNQFTANGNYLANYDDDGTLNCGWIYDEENSQPPAIKQFFPESNTWFLTTLENKDYDWFANASISVNVPTIVFTGENQEHNNMFLMGMFGNKNMVMNGSPGDGVDNAFPTSDDGIGLNVSLGDGGSDGSGGAGGSFSWKVGNQTNASAYQGYHQWLDGDGSNLMSFTPVATGNSDYFLQASFDKYAFNVSGTTALALNTTANEITIGNATFDSYKISMEQMVVYRRGDVETDSTTLDIYTNGTLFNSADTSDLEMITVLNSGTFAEGTYIEVKFTDSRTIKHNVENILMNGSADTAVTAGTIVAFRANDDNQWQGTVIYQP